MTTLLQLNPWFVFSSVPISLRTLVKCASWDAKVMIDKRNLLCTQHRGPLLPRNQHQCCLTVVRDYVYLTMFDCYVASSSLVGMVPLDKWPWSEMSSNSCLPFFSFCDAYCHIGQEVCHLLLTAQFHFPTTAYASNLLLYGLLPLL